MKVLKFLGIQNIIIVTYSRRENNLEIDDWCNRKHRGCLIQYHKRYGYSHQDLKGYNLRVVQTQAILFFKSVRYRPVLNVGERRIRHKATLKLNF